MPQLFANNVATTLGAALSSLDTTVTVAPGTGALFPSPSGGDFFLATIYKVVAGVEVNLEIVKCTGRSSDVLTVVRAREGTTQGDYLIGDFIELRLTKGSLELLQADILTKQNSDGDITAIAALAGTSGILKKTATNTWELDATGLNFGATTGLRIKGLFDGAGQSNRIMFQTSTLNGNTNPGFIPNGTGTSASTNIFNSSDPDNASFGRLVATTSAVQVVSTVTGTGTQLPLNFLVGALTPISIAVSGVVTFSHDMTTSGVYQKSGVQVVGARSTGWAAATGTATRTTFVTSTVTTAQLAERVKALIDNLIAHGLIGT